MNIVVGGQTEQLYDDFVRERSRTSHALHERVHSFDMLADVADPALLAEALPTDVFNQPDSLAADHAHVNFVAVHFLGVLVGWAVINFLFVFFWVLEVLWQVVIIPLEFAEEEE
jgi:hypothetical protein